MYFPRLERFLDFKQALLRSSARHVSLGDAPQQALLQGSGFHRLEGKHVRINFMPSFEVTWMPGQLVRKPHALFKHRHRRCQTMVQSLEKS